MKRIIIALVVVAIAGMSACKKEELAQPAKLKMKSVGDIKEHTGWDRGDSTEIETNP